MRYSITSQKHQGRPLHSPLYLSFFSVLLYFKLYCTMLIFFCILPTGCAVQLPVPERAAGWEAQRACLHPGLQPLGGQPRASLLQGIQHHRPTFPCPPLIEVSRQIFVSHFLKQLLKVLKPFDICRFLFLHLSKWSKFKK